MKTFNDYNKENKIELGRADFVIMQDGKVINADLETLCEKYYNAGISANQQEIDRLFIELDTTREKLERERDKVDFFRS